MSVRTILRDAGVAARLGLRALGRPNAARTTVSLDAWRGSLQRWLSLLPPGLVREHRFVDIPATRPPWLGSGIGLAPGDSVTWFASGRVYLSRALDVWVPPSFQLWARAQPAGPVFRGTRDSHTFIASAAGELEFASYFPGEWATPDGKLGFGAGDYGKVTGGMTVLVVCWARGTDVTAALARVVDPPAPVSAELDRLQHAPAIPEGWDYLWTLGPAEIFRTARSALGQPSICCDTHGDVGILRKPAVAPLEPGVQLDWRWRVDRLPADLREDSLPAHDYLSIAVEFDDGQDLTYYWSSTLPAGTVYRCPLPTWQQRETHVVVRSGSPGLGAWQAERRDLHADYRTCIGGTARSVVRVWLIANSLFLRGRGQCEYADIGLSTPDGARIALL